MADESLGTVLSALERSGAWDDTVVVFTSDHGDMCGSHGLRSKGPFVYDEIMKVPCYVKPAGDSPRGGKRSESLSSHVDLASTICGFAGVEADPGFQGVDLGPLVVRPRGEGARARALRPRHRPHVQHPGPPGGPSEGSSTAATSTPGTTASAVVCPNDDFSGVPTQMLYGPDAAFEDQEHEWYDHAEDPDELANLAMDTGRRNELRSWFEELRAIEAKEMGS